MKTTIGVGVTGIAGPTAALLKSRSEPFILRWQLPSGTVHRQFLFPGDREKIRWQASQAALDMVRRELMKM